MRAEKAAVQSGVLEPDLTDTLQVPGRGQTPHNSLLHQGAGVAGLGRVRSSDDHQGFPHLQVRPQDIPPS